MITHFMNHKRFLKSRGQYFDLDTRITDDGTSRTVLTTGEVNQVQDELQEIPKFAVEITIEDMEDMINNLKAHIRQIKKEHEEN
jgi:hypothetical protein